MRRQYTNTCDKTPEEWARELAAQCATERPRETDGFDDFFRDVGKWIAKAKPFVVAHKAAIGIAAVAIVGMLLIMLTFNRYEFMNVSGNLVRVDRLTGEAVYSVKGRNSFRPILTPDEQDREKMERERLSRLSEEELLRRLNGR